MTASRPSCWRPVVCDDDRAPGAHIYSERRSEVFDDGADKNRDKDNSIPIVISVRKPDTSSTSVGRDKSRCVAFWMTDCLLGTSPFIPPTPLPTALPKGTRSRQTGHTAHEKAISHSGARAHGILRARAYESPFLSRKAHVSFAGNSVSASM
ncbi:uncharacterized protein BKA78DRAFT_110986 [Phyllosticta capitalensis]|uniref:uncharacterized protein n=1 Tax=Phyllosticta capitalensis TaxID=121624 RepID=UPI003130C79A